MFESSPTTSSSTGGSSTVNYFDLGANPSAHHTSVIVPPRHSGQNELPLTPGTPYYPTNGYGFPLLLGTDFLQFPPGDVTSPLTPNISSPITPAQFCGFPSIPGANQFYSRPTFNDLYSSTSSTPMVQYSSKKSAAGRKPKEEDNMEDEDDDKKLKRRQRNKEAAARCRQRRLDLMKELQTQVANCKAMNEKKVTECNEVRAKLNSLKSFLSSHDCKLSPEELRQQLNQMIIPPPSQIIHQMNHQSLRIQTSSFLPRAGSTAPSVMSNHSSSSSEQHSPIEDYKPSIDQLQAHLPPISFIKDRIVNPMPPPQLPTSSNSLPIITSIPVPQHSSNGHHHPINRPSENVFAEPELKIPKLEMDRTLQSLVAPEDVERPSMLPMLSRNPVNQPITTPSRIFRNGEYYQTPQTSLFVGGDIGDFLATNTGLTPSGQPTMNFVSTPTPIQPNPDHDLRPL